MSTPSPTMATIQDLLRLDGRMAIVTGAAMGIGKAIAYRLAEAGAAVVVADADVEAATVTAKELTSRGWHALPIKVDVSDELEVAELFVEALIWRPELHILVNNAGIFPTSPVMDMTLAQYDHVQAVNLRGAFLCAQSAGRVMREQGKGGTITNITSIDALHPSAVGLAHYDASKHGLWGFTKNLALELAPFNIRVNAIAPGAIATPGATHMSAPSAGNAEAIRSAFVSRIPLKRMGDPDDVARLALVLAGDASSYVTGSQFVVDGGYLLT